jgi:hypothetical protein
MIGEVVMDFTSSALIGHVVVTNLVAKLVQRGILKLEDAVEIFDDGLLMLESYQKLFPENDAAFAEARAELDSYVELYSGRIG